MPSSLVSRINISLASIMPSMIRLTRAQVREIDKLVIERYHIPGIVLMENAARSVAHHAEQLIRNWRLMGAVVLCGGGNNGGDGLAIARHLHNRGFAVSVALTGDPAAYKGDALSNWRIVEAMQLPHTHADEQSIFNQRDALLVDAIFGTGLSAAPRDPFRRLANAVNSCGAKVLAVDVPSGLDCDTGDPFDVCIRAFMTVTFVAEKIGFNNPIARGFLGSCYVGDIGCPRELIEEVAKMSPR